jgi:hypothetical protein
MGVLLHHCSAESYIDRRPEKLFHTQEATTFSFQPFIYLEIEGTSFHSNPLNSSGD